MRNPRDPEQHKYANRCMDDFLANKEDASWVDGIKRLPPEQRGIAIETLGEDADQVEENEEDVFEEIGRHNEYLRERQVQGADDSFPLRILLLCFTDRLCLRVRNPSCS